jgi:hypothetical protein
MIYIESPNVPREEDMKKMFSIFVCGDITVTPWHTHISSLLSIENNRILFTPKKYSFMQDIEWGYEMIEDSDVIMFWFAEETLCPMPLFELGRWLHHPIKKPIFIGTHPNYKMKNDVYIQTHLAQPNRNFDIVHHPDDLVSQVRRFLKDRKKRRNNKRLLKDFYA